MKPSLVLQENRERVLALGARCGLRNVRVFGSVVRGEDGEGSDLDLLVDPTPEETTLFDLLDFQALTEEALGVTVDVRTPDDIHQRFRDRVLREARPL